MNWYVASVRSCQERRVAEKLAAQGLQTYVPVQKVARKWSDRVKLIDKLVFPGMVFIRCDSSVRLSVFDMAYGISGFLQDRTAEGHRPLVVPDSQMEDFIRVVGVMNGEDDLTVAGCHVAKGDMVRVVRGPLSGFVCECVDVCNSRKLVIRLGLLGSLLVSISSSDVVREV